MSSSEVRRQQAVADGATGRLLEAGHRVAEAARGLSGQNSDPLWPDPLTVCETPEIHTVK